MEEELRATKQEQVESETRHKASIAAAEAAAMQNAELASGDAEMNLARARMDIAALEKQRDELSRALSESAATAKAQMQELGQRYKAKQETMLESMQGRLDEHAKSVAGRDERVTQLTQEGVASEHAHMLLVEELEQTIAEYKTREEVETAKATAFIGQLQSQLASRASLSTQELESMRSAHSTETATVQEEAAAAQTALQQQLASAVEQLAEAVEAAGAERSAAAEAVANVVRDAAEVQARLGGQLEEMEVRRTREVQYQQMLERKNAQLQAKVSQLDSGCRSQLQKSLHLCDDMEEQSKQASEKAADVQQLLAQIRELSAVGEGYKKQLAAAAAGGAGAGYAVRSSVGEGDTSAEVVRLESELERATEERRTAFLCKATETDLRHRAEKKATVLQQQLGVQQQELEAARKMGRGQPYVQPPLPPPPPLVGAGAVGADGRRQTLRPGTFSQADGGGGGFAVPDEWGGNGDDFAVTASENSDPRRASLYGAAGGGAAMGSAAGAFPGKVQQQQATVAPPPLGAVENTAAMGAAGAAGAEDTPSECNQQ